MFIKTFFHKENLLRSGMAVVFVVLVIAAAAHMFNMFGYPYYENDEGIYMSQAWSLVTQGELSPYTYWYDHAPVGWMTLAGWTELTGGFFTFGPSVNTGRVLMALMHIAAAGFLFVIARRLSRGYLAGAIAVLLFSLSPLAVYYQRRVLLDNMMVFWVLMALAILSKKRLELWHVLASAGIFGIAVLTKESAIFFLPAFLYVLYVRRTHIAQKYVMMKWLGVAGGVMALYPLYALMRGELFSKIGVTDAENTISLIDTLLWQASRGSGLPFWDRNSEFMHVLHGWLSQDPYIVIGGIIVTVFFVVWAFFNMRARIIALLLVFGWFFLLRGKVVLAFYIVPLIPFIALAAGVLAQEIVECIGRKKKYLYYGACGTLLLVILLPSVVYSQKHFTENETAPQVAVIAWVKEHVPEQAKMVIDDYAYVDYHDDVKDGKVFEFADTFWKVESDDYIRSTRYDNQWGNIDYIIASSTLNEQVQGGSLPFIRDAYEHSRAVKRWRAAKNDYAYWTAVHKVDATLPAKVVVTQDMSITGRLEHSWYTYKETFIHSYGQVIDPHGNVTTSEGQSYAMLRAVWMDDKDMFDGAWQWTRDHLQFRNGDKLLSWKWVDGALADATNATDADEDIALALLFAYKQWGDEAHLVQAQEIIDDLWKYAIVEVNGRYHFLPAHREAMEQDDGFLLNPSYLSPATYRIFAEVDTRHDWNKLADDTYDTLHDIGRMEGNTSYLPPDWVFVQKGTGKMLRAQRYLHHDVDHFGFDAFRTLWRVSLDYQWFGAEDARQYLEKINGFLIATYHADNVLPSKIALDGTIMSPRESSAFNAGYLASLMASSDRATTAQFYKERVRQLFHETEGYWGTDTNYYYDANWAWFGSALYNGNLKNLWAR